MNLLFLDAYFEPESIAYTHLERDLIESLVATGHEIFVVCPVPTRGVDEETRSKYCKLKKEDLYDGHVHVTRFWAPVEGKNSVIRAFRYLWCNIRTYHIGKKINNIDVVFANSTPPTQGWLASRVSRKLKVPFVFNLQDIFPDSLVNTGLTNRGSFLWKIGRKIEDSIYKNASKIITISNDFKLNIVNKGVPEKKVIVVPNWVNTENVYPVLRNDNILFDRYKMDREYFYFCYCGNIGHTQNMDLLLDAAIQISEELPNVRFVLIGDGSAKAHVENRVKEEGIDNVIMLPFQQYEDIAYVFSLGDVGLIISKAGVGNNSVPSKTWSYMAAERPILASFDKDSDLTSLIDNIGCGVTIEAGEKTKLIEAIYSFVENPQLVDKGRLGREYLSTELDKGKCVGKYSEIIEQVGQSREKRNTRCG